MTNQVGGAMSPIPFHEDQGHRCFLRTTATTPNWDGYCLVRISFISFVFRVTPFICLSFVFPSSLFSNDYTKEQRQPKFDATDGYARR